jgi:hypothetical protein
MFEKEDDFDRYF